MFESGVGIRNPLFFIGVVEGIDNQLEGRIQVRAFGIHGTVQQVPTEDLPWATCIQGSYDANAPIPPLNSWVFGFFLDGRDAQHPMIIGLIPTQMTEEINPEINGWGVIPTENADVLAKGSRAEDFGQPARSRLARGENIEETYVMQQEMSRIENISCGSSGQAWSEPPSAYNARYPCNRVIETAKHSIEIDDTPNAERIMIWHNSGSYVQIDNRGTTTHKSVSDKYEVNDKNSHIYIGGASLVTIEGDSHVLVKGNKTEEITGDYIQKIRGNHMISVAGQANINASEAVQIRAAKVGIEGNVEDVDIIGQKNVNIFADGGLLGPLGLGGVNIKSRTGSINIQTTLGNINMLALRAVRITSLVGNISLRGILVAVDRLVSLANGIAAIALPATTAVKTSLPEPVSKSIGTNAYKNRSSVSTTGYVSQDDGFSNNNTLSNTATDTMLSPLLTLIGRAEGAGYTTVYSKSKLLPEKPITSMTIRELRNWQDRSVDAGSVSSAAGRYQIIRDTLDGLINNGVVSLDERFTPEVQDRLAISLIKGRNLNSYLAGNITKERFAYNLAGEWASFPKVIGSNPEGGRYDGIAGNSARISVSEVLSVIEPIRIDFQNQNTALA